MFPGQTQNQAKKRNYRVALDSAKEEFMEEFSNLKINNFRLLSLQK
jgi:hypothetical protein